MNISYPVRGIFLDIGWTMNAPASGQWMTPPLFYELAGKDKYDSIPKQRIDSALSKCMDYLDGNHLIRTEGEEFEQFKVYYKMLSDQLPELDISDETIKSIAYDKVYNDQNYIFYDDVKPALTKLRRSYKLGIISDTWPSAKRVLKSAGIYELFDSVTFSCELGVYKPHNRMYEHALYSLGIDPSQTVFVDDGVSCLNGAKKHGIQPVLITRHKLPDGHENFIKVKDFFDLITLLDDTSEAAGPNVYRHR